MPSTGELTPAQIARVIAQRIGRFYTSPRIEDRLKFLEAKERQLASYQSKIERTPHFCSGCPHNTSTKVPEGSRAVAGIGCHYMAVWMDRATETFTQMGGEGVPWIGQAPFTETQHIFANLGDGTYFHSGILAIRAAIAAGVNITYKILYNDAVAMTGGQPVDGQLSVPQIAYQLAAEGVRRIVVVSDEPEKYGGTGFPTGVDIYHRDRLDEIQRDLREMAGVTILIYDQTCAAEKRRRRKRGKYPDPPKRVFINEAVCEGCGDCSTQSNCLSVVPVETEFGRKRAIDQSSCNKDYSCVNGFCPSFVTVHGGSLRKPERKQADASRFAEPPEPVLPAIGEPYGILVTGVGGTGVVTIGALLGMAAHIEGKGVSVLDMTGLAQKGGAVFSHVRIANRPEDIHAVRIAAGDADLLIGCDIVVAASPDGLSKLRKGKTSSVVNAHETITGAFTRNPDFLFPSGDLRGLIVEATGAEASEFIDATQIATALLGDSIATNLFMLGFAYQKGLVPVSGAAIDRAIALNGVAVAFNREAFLWGRRAAHRRAEVEREAAPREPVAAEALSGSLDEAVSRRVAFLTQYQNAAYAARYAGRVKRVEQAERAIAANVPKGSRGALTDAVARGLFKLRAYKDEYEVARLYTDGEFKKQLHQQFEGDFRLEFHLAPPLLAERDSRTGHLKKRAYGAWMMGAFAVLARLKLLRGTALDVFGYSAERRTERRLIGEYETLVDELAASLTPENHAFAVALARLPERIRGYGHIKDANLAAAKAEEARLIALFRAPPPQSAIAAE
jgi:indolepyruvate ferredoxin oxidoreductase